MSKFAWIILVVVIAVIIGITGYLNMTGYIAFDSNQNCEEVLETYTAYEDNQVKQCKTAEYTEYGCEDRELTLASSDTECEKKCINDNNVACLSVNEEGDCIKYKYGICTEYELTCRLSFTNTDERSGTWRLEWFKKCLEDQPNCQGEESLGMFIYPLQPGQGKSSKMVLEFEEGAEAEMYSEFVKTPTYEFCGDLDKTRQDCKFITEQEPVERTRTVMVCN